MNIGEAAGTNYNYLLMCLFDTDKRIGKTQLQTLSFRTQNDIMFVLDVSDN